MSLSSAFEGLRNGLKDLGTIEVRSFTGDIDLLFTAEQGEGDFARLLREAAAEGKMSLKIYTRLDADGDSEHFVAASGVEDGLAASHVAAFQMGQEIRRSYIELFRDAAQRIL